jgi:hypothetical protein
MVPSKTPIPLTNLPVAIAHAPLNVKVISNTFLPDGRGVNVPMPVHPPSRKVNAPFGLIVTGTVALAVPVLPAPE